MSSEDIIKSVFEEESMSRDSLDDVDDLYNALNNAFQKMQGQKYESLEKVLAGENSTESSGS